VCAKSVYRGSLLLLVLVLRLCLPLEWRKWSAVPTRRATVGGYLQSVGCFAAKAEAVDGDTIVGR